ncbi:MAG TPA: aldo/keto reductase [Clostridia bacterium]|nr:aldo/keto reductase [Clostridia bacterium]
MKFLKIGNQSDGLEVSKLVMGTDKIVQKLSSDSEFFYLLDLYTNAGGNCIDTARIYCDGLSEEAVGRWLKGNGVRNRVVLSSKGCFPDSKNRMAPRLSKQDMEQDIDASLKALKTDCIDLYWLHRDDPGRPAEQIIEDLNLFVRSGKIRMIGCSNWKTERIQRAVRYADSAGLSGFCASQIQWSLASTREEIYQDYSVSIMDEHEYEWYLDRNMPVFAYASQAQGFFAKMMTGGLSSLSEKVRARFGSPENMERLKKAADLSSQMGVSLSAAALSYITCNRLPAAAIIGSKTPEHLRESLEAADLDISPEEADALYRVN